MIMLADLERNLKDATNKKIARERELKEAQKLAFDAKWRLDAAINAENEARFLLDKAQHEIAYHGLTGE